ncbi:MAG: ABC transporter substrate-binding protein [Clostridiales Family XIII bacterium]|jgi:ABC-type nitrate/sulfonate/bicarbonate transport system substrate-binding protein|nr:ABC transporter substrate-binding protein [Clostridiales Family XIII bacterium]
MKIRKSKLMLLIALITALSILAAACGGNAEGSGESDTGAVGSGAADGLTKATLILDWTPNTNHTGVFVAKSLGYYEDAGLDLDIQQAADGNVEQLIAAGQGDFGISMQEAMNYALTQDDPLPIKSIAAIIQHNTSGFISLPEAGIESPADWAGKTYGGWGSPSEENVIGYIAGKYGVSYDDINYVMLGEDDILTALKGDIDFAWSYEAVENVYLKKQGETYNFILAASVDEALDYYTPLLITSDRMIEEDPETVRAFLYATSRGYEYAIAHPGESAEILLKEAPELDEYVVKEGQNYLSGRYAEGAPQWGWQREEVWKRYADLMYRNGELPKELDVESAFTNEFLPEREAAR